VTLDDLRARIDELDEHIVELLNRRASCALEIGRIKHELGIELYQPGRERQVHAHVRAVNQGPLSDDAVQRLFERIIDEARRLERESLDASGRGASDHAPRQRDQE
jgi:chorismate mutase